MASYKMSLVFTIYVVCLPVAYFSPPSLELEDKAVISADHLEHLQRLTWFHCVTPQPRAIPVTELFEPSVIQEKAYYPDTTVLHRCDFGSGCCMRGGFCGPVRQQATRLPFKVTYLQDHGPHKRGSWTMEYHHLLNHTACGCVTEERAPETVSWTSS